MIENIYLTLLLVFFILAFAVRNVKTYLSTRQSIKGKSVKLSLSIVLSAAIYAVIFIRLAGFNPVWLAEIDLSGNLPVKYTGLFLVSAGFIFGLLALAALNDSWRVGIRYDQKTRLVTSGIYRLSRNPYFFSYHVLLSGFILLFPSLLLIGLYPPA